MATGEEAAVFTWSESARNDFQTVVESVGARSPRASGAPGRGAGTAFRLALANTIAAGWDDNRDKPGWALCLLLGELGRTDLALPTAIHFIWEDPPRLLEALGRSDSKRVRRNVDGTLWLEAAGGKLRLGAFRIRLLQSWLEFVLICDAEGPDADPETLVLDLDRVMAGEPGAEAAAAKRLSRLLYAYRRRHFDDGHATTAFSRVRGFLLEAGGRVGDDTVFDFWRAQHARQSRPTYAGCYDTVRAYVETLRAAQARAAVRSAADIDDPAFRQDDAGLVEGEGGTAETVEAIEDVDMLRETAVKFVTKETLAKLLTPLVRAGGFGRSLPLATLRLLSFHPIQSALSTELKTGQARIPTAQRVHCTEAVAYAELLAGIDETERRMKDWMTMALALVARGSDDAKLADIRAAGDALLKGRRGAAFGRDRDAIAADFAAATPALVAAAATLRGFSSAANAVLGDRAAAQFDTDRARFAEAFADLYLGAQARPA